VTPRRFKIEGSDRIWTASDRPYTEEDSKRVREWARAHRPHLYCRYEKATRLFWEVNGFDERLRDERRVGGRATAIWIEMFQAWQDAGEDSG
jgi:hypothetical protein